MNPLDYVRAALSFRGGLTAGATIPRIERSLPPMAIPERQLDKLRRLANYPSDGYLPLTFPFILAFPAHLNNMLDTRFPFPVMGTVHVRTAIHQIKPIGSGAKIETLCYVEGHRDTDKGVEFDLCTEVSVGGSLAWRGVATMLRRKPKEKGLPLVAPVPGLDGVGAHSAQWKLPANLSRQWAFATGDLNPIHLSWLTAKLFGFSGAIAHGSWIEMRLAGTQPELCRGSDVAFHCEFKQPITLPAAVVFRQWPSLGHPDTIELRLLNKSATKPHAKALIGPKETIP